MRNLFWVEKFLKNNTGTVEITKLNLKNINMSSSLIVLVIGILGSLASIAGFVIAYIQTRNLKKLQERKNKDTWMALAGVSTILRTLTNRNKMETERRLMMLEALEDQALNIYRALMKEATIDEKNFSSSTIQKWLRSGKISSWEAEQALKFVPTESIDMSSEEIFGFTD